MKDFVKILRQYWLLLITFSTGFLVYVFLHLRNPLVYGVDGAFYAGEIKCIISMGYPCLLDSPLPLYLPVLFVLIGADTLLAVKLALALFTSLTTIPVYMISFRATRSHFYAFISSLIYLFNPFTMRLGVEFLKNIVALFFFMFFIYYFYIIIVVGEKEKHKWLYPIILLIALSHILVYIILIAFTLIALLYSIAYSRNLTKPLLLVFLYEIFLVVFDFFIPVLHLSPYIKLLFNSGSSQLSVLRTIDYMSPEMLLVITSILSMIYALYITRNKIIILPILLLELTVLIPLPFFAGISWRLLLLFSIYLPLSVTFCYGQPNSRLTSIKSFIAIIILVFSITLSLSTSIGYYRPLLGQDIVSELENTLPLLVENNTIIIVPDKILRHWVFFTIAPNIVFEDYDQALNYLLERNRDPHRYVFFEILYSPNPTIPPPPPSLEHILLYRGRYIYVYELETG